MDAYKYVESDSKGNIKKVGGIVVNPAANIVPFDSEISVLADSIRTIGLTDAIVLYNGEIIDGRRRTAACKLVNVIPRFVDLHDEREYTLEELYQVVLAKNNRRNLSYTQKAMVAAKEVINKRHKLTKYKDGRDYAKNVWGVGREVFTCAKWLCKNYPTYAEELYKNGEVMINNKPFKSILSLK
jgi:hypothetical protein